MQLAGINKTALSTIRCCQFLGLAILHLSSCITLTFICPTLRNDKTSISRPMSVPEPRPGRKLDTWYECLRSLRLLILTTFRSSSKKPYQNLNTICPCARGLRPKVLQWVSMLLSCGVRAITATPEFPVLKSDRKHFHVCRVELGNVNKSHRFKSDVSGNRTFNTYLLIKSAIYETTKVVYSDASEGFNTTREENKALVKCYKASISQPLSS